MKQNGTKKVLYDYTDDINRINHAFDPFYGMIFDVSDYLEDGHTYFSCSCYSRDLFNLTRSLQ